MRRAIAEGNRRKWQDPDYRRRNIESHRGLTLRGELAVGSAVNVGGYRNLTMQYDHPLASAAGSLLEHRKVLYDKIGPGPHECHWNYFSRCGETSLEWGGTRGVQADHLDGDRLNNDPENVVPSCLACNRRGMRLIVARGLYFNNTSGVTGVSWDERTKKWRARAPGGRWLGRFATLELASAAVEAAKLSDAPAGGRP